MGTRGLWGLRKDGIDKLTYNHWDSYPTALGETIKSFILTHSAAELSEVFDKIILVKENSIPIEKQIKECREWTDLSVSKQSPKDWYCLLRKAQGEPNAYFNGLKFMIDNHNFIGDSLFCEWAYIINLDTKKLEVYEGFQKSPQDNRYKSIGKNEYANCKLMKEISFFELKKFKMKELEKTNDR